MRYPGGISDCPYCNWLDKYSNCHIANPVYNEKTKKWAVLCGECYRYGPEADSARYAIKAWNDLFENGVDNNQSIKLMSRKIFDTHGSDMSISVKYDDFTDEYRVLVSKSEKEGFQMRMDGMTALLMATAIRDNNDRVLKEEEMKG